METKNSISITQNSKIIELCDGNKVIESQTTFCVMGPTIFELWVMEIEIWVIEIDEPNTP